MRSGADKLPAFRTAVSRGHLLNDGLLTMDLSAHSWMIRTIRLVKLARTTANMTASALAIAAINHVRLDAVGSIQMFTVKTWRYAVELFEASLEMRWTYEPCLKPNAFQ